MTNLVFVQDNNLFTSSDIIAFGAKLEHRAVLQLLKKYSEDFQTFNPLQFEMRKGKPLPQGGFSKSTSVAILNEQQAMLLFTYFRNTKIVRQFKIALVKTFFEMRERLLLGSPQTLTPAHQLAIRNAVAQKAQKSALAFKAVYRALYEEFQVPSYKEIPETSFDKAITFINSMKVDVPALPKPDGVYISREMMEQLRIFIYTRAYLFKDAESLFEGTLRLAKSPYTGLFHDTRADIFLKTVERWLSDNGFSVQNLDCFKSWSMRQA